jgi:PilZ domain
MKTEQRSDSRDLVEQTWATVIDLESGVEFSGDVQNVSGQGVLFVSKLAPPVGAEMQVKLTGFLDRAGAMKVVRVNRASNGYEVAVVG